MSSFNSDPGPSLPSGGRGGGVARKILATMLLLVVVAVVAAVVLVVLGAQGGADVEAGKTVRVVIPKDSTNAEIGEILADRGVVRHKRLFLARLKLNSDGPEFRAGRYRMKTLSSYNTIVKTLEQGPPAAPTFRILFPEGMRLTEMAARIDGLREETGQGGEPLPRFTGAEYLAAVKQLRLPVRFGAPKGTTSLEGFLFPSTYTLKETATAADLASLQLRTMEEKVDGLNLKFAQSKNLTVYDVVNIAAMVEREARLDKERPLVAAVIYNRLRLQMTLGIDATIQYAVSDKGWDTSLTQSELDIDSPYNTRKVAGLPPTPIANPGLKSLEAAAKPADDTDVLYYVAKPDGSGAHTFTDSYDEFLAAQ